MKRKPKPLSYLERIIIASAQIEPKPGTITNMHVQHDQWCDMLKGKPSCNCNPDIQIDMPLGLVEVGPQGEIININ